MIPTEVSECKPRDWASQNLFCRGNFDRCIGTHGTAVLLLTLASVLLQASPLIAVPPIPQAGSSPTIQNVPYPNIAPSTDTQQQNQNAAMEVRTSPASHSNSDVVPASYTSSTTPLEIDSRPLAPPSRDLDASSSKSSSPFGMFLSLLFVVGLILAAGWTAQKMGWTKALQTGLPNDIVEVVGRQAIGGRQQLLLVKFGSKVLLVSNHQGDARTLSEITDPVEVRRLLERSPANEQTEGPILRNLFGGKSS